MTWRLRPSSESLTPVLAFVSSFEMMLRVSRRSQEPDSRCKQLSPGFPGPLAVERSQGYEQPRAVLRLLSAPWPEFPVMVQRQKEAVILLGFFLSTPRGCREGAWGQRRLEDACSGDYSWFPLSPLDVYAENQFPVRG